MSRFSTYRSRWDRVVTPTRPTDEELFAMAAGAAVLAGEPVTTEWDAVKLNVRFVGSVAAIAVVARAVFIRDWDKPAIALSVHTARRVLAQGQARAMRDIWSKAVG